MGRLRCCCLFLSPVGALLGQEAAVVAAEVARAPTVLDEIAESVTPYGSLRVRLAGIDGAVDMQNGASRGGVRLSRRLDDDFAVIGQVELAFNLVANNRSLSAGDSSESGLLVFRDEPAVSTRLGWIGVDGGDFGKLTIGKQWGTYYDVAGWTDEFPVFGGEALGVFSAGTDGGALGTGRAEKAVQYQAKDLDRDSARGWGASAVLHAHDRLAFGVAYNDARISQDLAALLGSDPDPRALVIGGRYTGEDLQLALCYAQLWDQEVAVIDATNGVYEPFGGNAVELYARLRVCGDLHAIGGLGRLDPQDASSQLPDRFGVDEVYLGGEYCFDEQSKVYLMYRGSRATEADGSPQPDAVVLGMQLDF